MDESARILEQDLELCEKATPGPWDKIKRKGGHLYLGTAIKPVVDVCNLYGDESKANLSFIAAAREALPYWLGEVRRLRELTDALGDEVLGANADLAKANIALRSELVILRFQLKATLAVVEAARLALSKILAVPCSEWPEYINDAAYILKDAIDGVTTQK